MRRVPFQRSYYCPVCHHPLVDLTTELIAAVESATNSGMPMIDLLAFKSL